MFKRFCTITMLTAVFGFSSASAESADLQSRGHHHKRSSSSSSSSSDSDSHSRHENECIQVPIEFEAVDQFFDPIGETFTITATIRKEGNWVTIQFPGFNWQQTAPGFLKSTSVLPTKLRPLEPIPPTLVAPSNYTLVSQSYNLQVRWDGSIVIASQDNQPLSVGAQTVSTCSLEYTLCPALIKAIKCWQPPKNFIVDEGKSHPGVSVSGLLDWYKVGFSNGKLAYCYADNSNYPENVVRFDTKNCVADVSPDGKTVSLGTPQVVEPSTGNNIRFWENSIAVNPLDTTKIVYSTRGFQPGSNSLGTGRTLFTGFSADGGQTWTSLGRVDDPVGPLPNQRADANLIYDIFGNCWMTYVMQTFDSNTQTYGFPFSLQVVVSTDNGQSWTAVKTFDLPAPYDWWDYPMITFGADGSGGYAVYCSGGFVTSNGLASGPERTLGLASIPVTGLGQYDANASSLAVYSSIQGTLPAGWGTVSIAVSDEGVVIMSGAAQRFDDDFTFFANSQVSIFRKLDGTANIVDGNYEGIFGAIQTNFGGGFFPPWQIDRGVNTSGNFANVLFDNNRKILYQLFSDQDTAYRGSDPVYYPTEGVQHWLSFSRNNGRSWSPRLLISDSVVKTRGLASFEIDPTTGNLAFGWYDSRNSRPAGDEVQYFGAVLPASKIDKILEAGVQAGCAWALPPSKSAKKTKKN